MPITLQTPTVDELDEVVDAVSSWQREGRSVQLHPGDLGWNWMFGAAQLAGALRVWRDDRVVLAAGLVEDGGLVRMGIAPSVDDDRAFAERLLTDLAGAFSTVESRSGAALRALLAEHGWLDDEPWTPLRRDLTDAVEDCGLRIRVVDADTAPERVAVQRAAFEGSAFTLERWRAMAGSPAYRRARCLVGYDADDTAVAAVTVWSAGPGRPGLLEPMGVHRDHRGRGHGRAISLAAAAALREMGASSANVCTPASNAGGVATYASAGYTALPDVTDLRRAD
jgi:GNAT superfamily N-acetyltransferase